MAVKGQMRFRARTALRPPLDEDGLQDLKQKTEALSGLLERFWPIRAYAPSGIRICSTATTIL